MQGRRLRAWGLPHTPYATRGSAAKPLILKSPAGHRSKPAGHRGRRVVLSPAHSRNAGNAETRAREPVLKLRPQPSEVFPSATHFPVRPHGA